MWNNFIANIYKSKALVLLCIMLVVLGIYWYQKPKEETEPQQKSEPLQGPDNLNEAPNDKTAEIIKRGKVATDFKFSETSPNDNRLERNCRNLNSPDLDVQGLKVLLSSGEELNLIYPEKLKSLKIPAIELGDTSLGNILAGLFSPHNLAIYRQNTDVQVIPATYERSKTRNPTEPPGSLICNMQTSFTLTLRKPADLWIDTLGGATHLRMGVQHSTEKEDDQSLMITIEARRNNQSLFLSSMNTTMGKPAVFETMLPQRIQVHIGPLEQTSTTATLQVLFESEIVEQL